MDSSEKDPLLEPRTPRFTPRNQEPRRRWIVTVALIVAVVAAGAFAVRSLTAPPQAQVIPTPNIPLTATPKPTQPTLPKLDVGPWRALPDDARLGGTRAGFTRAFGPQADPDHASWTIDVNGASINIGGYIPFSLSYISDGKEHFSNLDVSFGAHGTVSSQTREAVILSFLPKDAVYVGESRGSNALMGTLPDSRGFTYTSASLAAIYAPHPDRVFTNGQNQGVAAGTFTWVCSDGGPLSQQDECIVATGTLS
ncbi:MAG TPA: hypothetical protein VF807_13300 [Ktedonobacterales bacterium]